MIVVLVQIHGLESELHNHAAAAAAAAAAAKSTAPVPPVLWRSLREQVQRAVATAPADVDTMNSSLEGIRDAFHQVHFDMIALQAMTR